MRDINLFIEDYGHEAFLTPLIHRLAAEFKVDVRVRPSSVRGGFGAVATELEKYVDDVQKYVNPLPDLVLLATDSNCEGFLNRRKGFQKIVDPIKDRVVYAIPDPHIEKWMLVDSAAFKQVLGTPCAAPDQKCDRARYKKLLMQAVRDAGVTPLLGGMEHAEDLVQAMNLEHVRKADAALGELLAGLESRFRLWQPKPPEA